MQQNDNELRNFSAQTGRLDFWEDTKEDHYQDYLTPKFGCAKGQIFTSPDFDEPVEDFKEYIM